MPFVKIWTTIKQDEWFLGLSCIERGAWLQCLVEGKSGEISGKKGGFFLRGWSALASILACDRKTTRKILGKFHRDGKIILTENENGTLSIEIPNYQYWQGLKSDSENNKDRKSRGKIREISPQIRVEKNRIEKNRIDFVPSTIEKAWDDLNLDDPKERSKFDLRIDFTIEKKKMLNWASVHPPKKNWKRFIINWLNRAMSDIKASSPEVASNVILDQYQKDMKKFEEERGRNEQSAKA